MFYRCYFFYLLTVALETSQLSQNILDIASPNFQDKNIYGWATGHDQFGLLFAIGHARVIAIVTDFWHERAKIGVPHLHSVRWHSTTDRRIATRMCALTPPMTFTTPDRNWVHFGPVTPEFCSTGWATGWALPYISSCDSVIISANGRIR